MAKPNAPSIQHVDANGLRFAYIEEGDGPLVLLCHGFPDTARTWDDLRPRLAAAGYRAVSPYMRGYAPSQIPSSPPDVQTLGRDVLAWIDALGASGRAERACVVGHDWGGFATYAASAMDPDRIDYAIVVDIPHPMAVKPSLRLLWYARHFVLLNLPGAASRFRRDDFAQVATFFRRWSPTWRYREDDVDQVRQALSPAGAAEAAVAYYRMLRSGKPDPIFKRKIRVPTTAVAGLDQPMLTPSMFEAARRGFDAPYDVATMPGGHFMHREHPDQFAELVLSRLPPP